MINSPQNTITEQSEQYFQATFIWLLFYREVQKRNLSEGKKKKKKKEKFRKQNAKKEVRRNIIRWVS